jgi:predicted AAA+ superfamily ATPase
MEKYQRPVFLELRQRIAETPRRLIVLAGPRQVGKTTGVMQLLSARPTNSCAFYAVDEPQHHALGATSRSQKNADWLADTWVLARQAAMQWHTEQQQLHAGMSHNTNINSAESRMPYVLVFDEIHNIPNWSSTVKGLWDADRRSSLPMHVVVLGSAPLLMQRDISESLMGRYETIHAPHWSLQEMHDAFGYTLDQYIYFGGYPGPAIHVLNHDEKRWKDEVIHALIEPNLVKDVLALARIEKPALLRHLFILACSYSAQIVAMTKLQAQLQDAGNTTTLSHYLELLRAAGLIAGIQKYSAKAIQQRSSPPKLNVLNTAFQSVYSGLSFEQAKANPHHWGHLVESAIGAHLLNTASGTLAVNYWRGSPLEVDFVLVDGQQACAIEVKSGRVKPNARKGLQAFTQQHEKLNTTTRMVGEGHFDIAQALTTPAQEWLQ